MGLVMKYEQQYLVFILDYFQEKLMITFFKKSPKHYFLAMFAQIWAKMNFPEIKDSVFKYSIYLPFCQKSEKNNKPFLKKMLKWKTDRQMDRKPDGQTGNSDFIGTSTGQGSNKASCWLWDPDSMTDLFN